MLSAAKLTACKAPPSKPSSFDFDRKLPLITTSMTNSTASTPIFRTVLPGVESRAGRAILCRVRKISLSRSESYSCLLKPKSSSLPSAASA